MKTLKRIMPFSAAVASLNHEICYRRKALISSEKRLSHEEEERLIGLSIVPLIPLLGIYIAYLAYLRSMGVIASFEGTFQYALVGIVLWLAAGFGIYEIASSFKVKKQLLF